jgi:hypothetical protein
MSGGPNTTVVITSCNRHDLLERTLQSFVHYNTDPHVTRILVVEDGSANPSDVCRRFGAEVLRIGERVGQIRAIDLAYAKVDTPYIFHLEDDWEFYRSGFVEKSRKILDADPATLLVWLRAWSDTNNHPLSFKTPDESFGVMATGHTGYWHGFTFNPGLRRLSDYKRLGTYGGQTRTLKVVTRKPMLIPSAMIYEAEASVFYHKLGYRAVILDKSGYVRHIGEKRHVRQAVDQIVNMPPDAPCPCGSGKHWKDCHGRPS